MKSKESELDERKRDIDRVKEKIERETNYLSDLEKSLEQETKSAYDPAHGTSAGNIDKTEDAWEDTSTEQETTNTTDYPGFYDVTLADSIPNQTYYAQASDGGWTVGLGANFEEYSLYDKSNQRGSGDLVKGWLCKDGKWYAFNDLGRQVTGWVSVGGYWYCIYPGTEAEACYMMTGWQEINSNWYYLNSSGQMVANCVVDGYTIGADGIWRQ